VLIVVEERKGEGIPVDEFRLLEERKVDKRKSFEDRKSVEDLNLGEGGDTVEEEVRKEDGGSVNDELRGMPDDEVRKGDDESVEEVLNGEGGTVEAGDPVVVEEYDVEENRTEDRGDELGEGEVEDEMDVVEVIVVVETRHVLEEVRVIGGGRVVAGAEEFCVELSWMGGINVGGELLE
jgi:hypothetical protein